MGASAAELPPPGDTSVSDASAAKDEGKFENFAGLCPLLPQILGIQADDLWVAKQSTPTANSASADTAAASVDTGGKEEVDDQPGAGAASTDDSAAGTEKPVWLNFTATKIHDINPEAVKGVSQFSRTNRFFREKLAAYMGRLPEQLVALVLNGREDEAKELIEACPFLLEGRATVTDPVGRVYEKVTAYEAALYAGDTKMCDMMHPFFEKHRGDGEAIRLEQYNNVFPEGVQAVAEKQHTYDFESLIDAIDKATAEDVTKQLEDKVVPGTDLGKAINLFRHDFVALSKQEQHANLKHLLKAFELYANDIRIAAWESAEAYDKMDVFWRQVIGFVQLFLPECDKQVFHQGLYYVVELNELVAREVDFKHDRGKSLRFLEGFSGCGFDYSAAPRWAHARTYLPLGDGSGQGVLNTYVKQKHQTWKDYATADKPCETMRDSMT